MKRLIILIMLYPIIMMVAMMTIVMMTIAMMLKVGEMVTVQIQQPNRNKGERKKCHHLMAVLIRKKMTLKRPSHHWNISDSFGLMR